MIKNVTNTYHTKGRKAFLKITNIKNETFTITFDIKDLNKVKKHKWYYNNGNVCSKYAEHYLFYVITGLKKEKNKVITFKNGNRLDFRKSNLYLDTRSNVSLKKGKSKRNKSDHIGVFFDKYLNKWVAEIYVLGKTYKKRFSVDKYGYEKAKDMAIEKRLEFEKEFIK